jgi:glycopeptide antibiotics resistance protein
MGDKPPQNINPFTELKPKSWVLWFLLIVLSIAPLFQLNNFVGHPHWDHIRWIPFQDFSLSRNMVKDIVGNTLWFVMVGYLLHYQLNGDSAFLRSIPIVTTVAGGISLSIEFFQVFCHNRIPAMTDVVCNALGPTLGGYWAEKQRAAPLQKYGQRRGYSR